MYGMFVEEMKSDGFHNLNETQQLHLLTLIDLYKDMAEQRQQEIMQMQMMQAQMQNGGGQGGGEGEPQ
jgi:hypothetical protein